jgi:crossover junction endodeoxyribonuclease RuvC
MKNPYKILGVDPGTNILGYGLIQVEGNSMKLITLGVLRLQSYPDHQTKLKEIFLQLQEIIETYLPTKMAIEAPFYGKNVQSMLKLGRAQGVAMAAGITMGMEIAELSPKRIKQSVTGNGNASKEQVAAMLDTIFRAKITIEHLDATDALAAAVCLFNQSGRLGALGQNYSGWKSFLKDNPKKVKKG